MSQLQLASRVGLSALSALLLLVLLGVIAGPVTQQDVATLNPLVAAMIR